MTDAALTILVIEDQKPSWETVREVLTMYGYRPVLAGNHSEAEAYLADHRGEVRAILSDNNTRESGGKEGAGYEWLTDFQERSQDVPVRLLYTGDFLFPEQKAALAAHDVRTCDKVSGLKFLDMITHGLTEKGEAVPPIAQGRLGGRITQLLAERAAEAEVIGRMS